ncbi:MAG: porin family protein [Proteobacteria bacterium]|nr:porin family protein [Pseudomonadota bacterium]
MRIQVSIATAASILAFGSVGARAADAVLEPAPVVVTEEAYDWSGVYVGVHGGYGHGRSDASYTGHTEYWDDNLTDPSAPGDPGYEDTLQLYPGLSGSYSDQIKRHLDGAFGGAQIGYNYQHSNLVFGAIADISAANIKSESVSIGDVGQFSVGSKVDWFGTVRGRFGIAQDRILFFGTGGLAYGHVKTSYDYSVDGDDYSGSSSKIKAGWTLGGGTVLVGHRSGNPARLLHLCA